MSIGAVIVAAGMSSRMGDFKPMLSIGSQSIARRIVSTLRQTGAEEIVMITGHNADALERHLEGCGLTFIRNERYATTQMFDSAALGLNYLKDKCGGYFSHRLTFRCLKPRPRAPSSIPEQSLPAPFATASEDIRY